MCGIVGVLGHHEVAPMMVEALRRLEYRGYDSAGIATINHGTLDRRRATGKLVHLSDLLVHDPLAGKAGIGHTRWATHGGPTVRNAHPHVSGGVAVVHNGIIENFRDLKAELEGLGYTFESDTDTEIVATLVRRYLEDGMDADAATAAAVARLEGAFALGFLFEGDDDLIIVARKGSPLAIGYGDGEMFVGSDAIALAPMTDRIAYLEEGDRAVIRRAGAVIYDAAGNRANRKVEKIRMDAARIEKAGYKHFMAKEIAEQPVVLGDALSHYIDADGKIILPAAVDFKSADRIVMSACGTAYIACQVAKYWFEHLAGIPVDTDVASEFRYRDPVLSSRSIALFVSQSGETADTLAALRHAQSQVAQTVGVVNVATSSIAREADAALPILAGVEIGVASTKAFTCQLLVLALLALRAGVERGRISEDELAGHVAALRSLPGLVNTAIGSSDEIERLARRLSEAKDAMFIGRGPMFPLALEGALKLKEISYIHAEGYAAGELKHGPIALIDDTMPVIVMAPRDALFDKTVSNMQEVMARNGRVLLISDHEGIARAGNGVTATIRMPEAPWLFAPILYAIPAQLLAYHTAVAKGTDVDQPRNLAKSVTVE